MKKMRRVIASLSMVAILSMLVVSTTASAGQYFDDVPDNAWYASYVNDLADMGVIDTSNDNYRPGDNVNRAEAVKLLVEAFDLQGATDIDFSDMTTGDWYYNHVKTAVANGLVVGYSDGTFRGGFPINRAEWAKMVVIAADLPECDISSPFPDVPAGEWYEPYATTAYCWSVIDGYADGTFGGVNNATRAEAAKMISMALNPMPREEDPADPTDPTDPVTTGDLNVSLNAANPTPGTLPSGATSIAVGMFDFTAGTGGATLQSLKIHTYGVTSLPTTHSLYLYDGTERLTSGKSINSSTNEASFNNLNIAVAAGETKTLTLKLSTGTVSTATEAAFEIENVEAVTAGESTVGGTFPIQAGTWSLSTVSAGTVTVEKNGTITNAKVGEDDATIAKFKISAATEAASLEEIGLLVTGTISNDAVENFELYVSGTDDPIATTTSLNSSDLAVFVLDTPYEITKGDTKAFTMKADFNTGRSADTVLVYIDETTDVVAIGGTYGFGMTVTIDTSVTGYDGTTVTCTATAGTCSGSTLQGGDITVTSSGPSAADIGIGEDDIHLMNFSVVSISDVTFKNWPIYLVTTGSATNAKGLMASATQDNFTDIKIINTDTGETLMGPIDASAMYTGAYSGAMPTDGTGTDDDGYYLFTDEFDMSAGEELNLALTADVYNATALEDETVYGEIQLGTTYPQIKDVNNKTITNSTSLVPASAITGKVMTVASPSLTMSLAAVPIAGATTQVIGQEDVQFVGMSAKCGSASTCKLTDIVLTGYYDSGNDGTFAAGTEGSIYLNAGVGSVWILDGNGEEVAAAKSVSSAGVVTYDNLTYELDAGDTEIFYVVGDLTTNATATDRIAFTLADAGISFEDDDGTTRTSANAVNGTTAATNYVLTSAGGSLTIAVDPSTAKENIAVAGASDVEVSKFKFTTTDEPFTVKKLSINARQSAIAYANLADYDNNIHSLKISYTNSAGETETKTGYLTSGTANFSGMDMYIAKDDDAVLTVSSTLNTIANGATAGEYIDLNIAFNDFEALAGSSGTTYKADKIDATRTAATDLDFGTITWSQSSDDIDTGDVVGTGTLGASTSFTIDDGTSAVDQYYPAGTLFCVDESSDCAGTCTEDIYVVTAISGVAGTDTELTVTATLLDDAGSGTYTNADDIWYSLPGTGYLSSANRMHVYETLPTLTLSSSSPSGSRTTSTADTIFKFNVTADSNEKVQLRAAVHMTGDCVVGVGPSLMGDETDTTTYVDGSSCQVSNMGDALDSVAWPNTADLTQYAYVSFWIYYDDDSGTTALTGDSLSVYTGEAAATMGQETAIVAANIGGTATTDYTDTAWEFVHDVAMPIGTDSGDVFIGVTDYESTELIDADIVRIDQLMAYNDKIEVSFSSDASMATGGQAQAVYLKGGTTNVTGYMMEDTTSAGSVTFIPTTALETAKSSTTNYYVETDTTTLITNAEGTEDLLTPSISYGSSADPTITAGGFWWNDTNADTDGNGTITLAETTTSIIKWLGYQSSSALNGNTLKY